MPRSYAKLTREQWREIADVVKDAEKAMYDVTYVLGGKFPRMVALDRSLKLYRKIGELKSLLDTELGKQYRRGEMSDEEFSSYFYPFDNDSLSLRGYKNE